MTRANCVARRHTPHAIACVLALVFLCTGCTQKMVGSTYAPTQKQTDHSAKALYDAAIRVLTRRGYDLASRDPDALTMETAYVEKSQPPVAQLQYAWRITTAGGVLGIHSSCKYNDGWSYEECPSDTRPAALIEEERILVREILADAAKGAP